MFQGILRGQKIWLKHVASESFMCVMVVDVSEHGGWIEIPGGQTLYDDGLDGWELS